MKTGSPQDVLRVVLCWHMHQPDYRHHGRILKPWTWLHAIKDYSDMAAHLEQVPGARAVVNFSPVLLCQLQDLPERINASIERGETIGEPILDLLGGRHPQAGECNDLIRALLRVNEATMKQRVPAYARGFDAANRALQAGRRLPGHAIDDLAVGYVLTWLGESLRSDPLVARLTALDGGYTPTDRLALLVWLGTTIAGLLPRYRALAEAGRIELSITPFSHPILPLLLDMASARDALPDVTLPSAPYPGGAQRCSWQLSEARRIFRAAFGTEPQGCWPSEGGLSEDVISLLGQQGFRWTAGGAQVLFNSLGSSTGHPQLDAWRLDASQASYPGPVVYFRDDELSDRIGFEYARWPAADAVADLVGRLEHRLDEWEPAENGSVPLLAIIMDGENAWEYYPENGQAFLTSLYAQLAAHPRLQLTTFSEAQQDQRPRTIPGLRAGSWVHGTFSTWVGDAAKNRAWELLCDAKRAVDAALGPSGPDDEEATPRWASEILRQLAVCEASDWFWWLGPDNRLQDGPEFDRLFRQQLAELYRMLGMVPPEKLARPLDPVATHHTAIPALATAGAMRPAQEAG